MVYIILFSILLVALLVLLLVRYFYKQSKADEIIKDRVVLKIEVPVNNDKDSLAAEQLFQSLHGVLKNRTFAESPFSFEIVATHKGIYFLAVCATRYEEFLQNQIYAQYPTANINRVQDYTFTDSNLPANTYTDSVELAQAKAHYLPIRTFTSFDVDPLASITSAISKLPEGYQAWIQLIFRPINNEWQKTGKFYVNKQKNKVDSSGNKVALESGEVEELKEIETKNTKVGFQFVIRVHVVGPNPNIVSRILEDVQASFKQFQTAHLNSLTLRSQPKGFLYKIKILLLGKRLFDKLSLNDKYHYRFLDSKSKNIINIEELASIYHLPNESVQTPNIAWAISKKLEFPINLPTEQGVRFFAKTDYRNIEVPFGLRKEDRRRHVYLLGKTGSGKSTLLRNMISADVIEGKGVGVIDPHGDLVEEVLEIIPEHRAKDVVYLDPSDLEYPVGLNMLDAKEDETKELLADGIVTVFEKYFGDSWGPRLHYILLNTVLTLLNCQNVSFLAIQRILVDANYRTFLLKQVKDPFILKFWEQEFAQMASNPRMLAEALAPIQNKVGRFLNSAMIRNMFGQVKSTIQLDDIMNSEKIFLVNLSQGKIGEENSSLLGAMLVTRLYSNAMQRASIPKDQRKDFYLYVDEFQNFATPTFIKILSEARKYGLNLIITHQYIDQISEDLQRAIFGNVGTLMNYVVGQRDAHVLAEEFAPYLESTDLVNLGRFKLTLKLMIDGRQTNPFTATALPPSFTPTNITEQVKQLSRESYAKDRAMIEEKLAKWGRTRYSSKGNLIQENQGEKDTSSNDQKPKSPHHKK